MSAMDNSSAFALSESFARRQFLPASLAVKGPRFKRRTWSQSQLVREMLDSIYLEVAAASANAPRPEPVASSESIVMSGPVVRATYRSESGQMFTHEFTAPIGHELELSVVEVVPALVDEPDSLRDAAAQALVQLNLRRVAPARRAGPMPRRGLLSRLFGK
jgi:hypothetical protein